MCPCVFVIKGPSVQECAEATLAIAPELVALDGNKHLLRRQILVSLHGAHPIGPGSLKAELLGRGGHQLAFDGIVTLGTLASEAAVLLHHDDGDLCLGELTLRAARLSHLCGLFSSWARLGWSCTALQFIWEERRGGRGQRTTVFYLNRYTLSHKNPHTD